MDRQIAATATATAAALVLAACGGGGDDGTGSGAGLPVPTLEARTVAARATAESTANACAPIGSFWWEIGDGAGVAASGSVVRPSGRTVGRDTRLEIASASKWLYAISVVEQRGGAVTASDVRFLTLTSGHTSFDFCRTASTGTVGDCAVAGSNGVRTAAAEGRFFYGGSHMQQHAAADGLGTLDGAALGVEMRRRLGGPIGVLAYERPWIAGGATTTPADYGTVLAGVVSGRLAMRGLLGTSAVCIDPSTCATALFSPIVGEGGSYSLGHFVENDPGVGDGAFSSAGAYGFYPWIDATRSWYGIVAREVIGPGEQSGETSMRCGRLIRTAWMTGVAR
jgi:hypothetical protein